MLLTTFRPGYSRTSVRPDLVVDTGDTCVNTCLYACGIKRTLQCLLFDENNIFSGDFASTIWAVDGCILWNNWGNEALRISWNVLFHKGS